MSAPRSSDQASNRASELLIGVARLASSDLSPRDFLAELIVRLTTAVGGLAGAVWVRRADGRLYLAGGYELERIGSPDDRAQWEQHARLASEAFAAGRSAIYLPDADSGETGEETGGEAGQAATVIVSPLGQNGQTIAVLEIVKPPAADREAETQHARLVHEACQLAGEYFHRHGNHGESNGSANHHSDTVSSNTSHHHSNTSDHSSAERQDLWGRLDGFLREVHRSLKPRSTALALANEGRRLIGCDRVSVAVARGKKYRIEAISGQDHFDRRSNAVRGLTRLANAVARTGEALYYPQGADDLPPQLQRVLDGYLDEAHSKLVMVLPLARGGSDGSQPEGWTPARRRRPIAMLIAEQIDEATPPPALEERLALVRQHGALALTHALEHDGIFLLPLWRFLGGFRRGMTRGWLAKMSLVVGLLAALTAALVLVPYDFEIEARGTLEPVARREIFARLNGHVSEVHVEHMQGVTSGMPLVTLESPELDAKIVEIQGQIQAKQKELDAVEAVRIGDRSSLTRPDEKQLLGRKLEIEATLKSLADQLSLYQVKQADLVARSPVDGSVVTLDVRQRLSGRPVQPGDSLLTVADTAAEWELEVFVPDHHIGYVTAARDELVRETALGGQGDLRVRFILATDPGVSYYGSLKQIDQRAEVRGDEGNTVLAKVRIRREELAELRPGASVVARIDCGRRSLGFVFFHDLLDFVQSRILFRL